MDNTRECYSSIGPMAGLIYYELNISAVSDDLNAFKFREVCKPMQRTKVKAALIKSVTCLNSELSQSSKSNLNLQIMFI